MTGLKDISHNLVSCQDVEGLAPLALESVAENLAFVEFRA